MRDELDVIYNLPVSYQKEADWELVVRNMISQDHVPEHDYPYLVVKPYPEPYELRFWLRDQFPDSDQYVIWKGWILFRHEADAVMTAMTWWK